jgi:hypothetical protein
MATVGAAADVMEQKVVIANKVEQVEAVEESAPRLALALQWALYLDPTIVEYEAPRKPILCPDPTMPTASPPVLYLLLSPSVSLREALLSDLSTDGG